MDPDTLLMNIVDKINDVRGADETVPSEELLEFMLDLCEDVQNLVCWLSRGGHPPRWSEYFENFEE